MRMRSLSIGVGAVVVALFATGCKKKATQKECDALIEHYAEIVVSERLPEAGAPAIKAEQDKEKSEARGDDSFKNCSSEVQIEELQCAMSAKSSEAIRKCLE